MSVEKKVALVTGASRGIGTAIALELARQGIFVIGTGTSTESAEKFSSLLEEYGLAGKGVVLDVSNTESIQSTFAALEKEFSIIDILVNNAGITRDNLFLRMKEEEWLSVIQTNLNSAFYLTKLVVKGMLKQRWGRVINITSVVAETGNPGQANYCAAKAGLIGFTKSLAQELASRFITCNAVAPGFIETSMTHKLTEEQKKAIINKVPVGRMGTPEEIAAVVKFLVSEPAGYITGQTIHVNGGMVMV